MNTESKTRLIEARTAATDLLRKMETEELPAERYLLQAKRIARLLRDTDAQTWLNLEISGYREGLELSLLGNCLQYAKDAGRISDDGKYYVTSLPRLEAACASDKQRVENASAKPSTGTAENFVAANATAKMFRDQLATLNSVKKTYLENVALYSAMKAAIHSYITDTLIALEFGDVAESIFDELRHDVDTFIRSHSPKSAEKLIAIAERMAEGNSEAFSEALTSCRRLLMTLADSVFPPSETDWTDSSGKKRKIGKENYKNRLIAFIESKILIGSTKSLLESDLEHLCSRLDAVYDKACKGVHADVSAEEARLTIIQAYIFIGEIARTLIVTDQQSSAVDSQG